MKQLFRKLFERKPRRDLAGGETPDPDSRRLTRDSASPLNKVLVTPAVARPAEKSNQFGKLNAVDRVMGNADLDLDKAEEAFNPYNTSAFDRASSWDKISHQKKR